MGDYNKFAKEYEQLTEKLEKQTRKHTYSLITTSLKGKKLLDVGCGSGCDAMYYSKKGADVFGIDISEKEIEIIKKKVKGEFTVGNMNKLSYQDNTFDIVTSTYAIQASENVTKSINEMIRVAKKGAEILIVAKHPFRNLLEGNVNDKKKDYFKQTKVTSFIFNRKIKLIEPSHTMTDYLHKSILQKANLEIFEEHNDFPASEQVIKELIYPTFMILRFRKI
jgi:ubiquinone/menaquinone biosynthesis C-methylase UbiE